MSDGDNGGRFDARQASPEQVQLRLRQLGIGTDTTMTAALPYRRGSNDPAAQRLQERNEQRKLNRYARQAEYAARLQSAMAGERAHIDGRTATAEQAAQRLRQMGLSTAGMEPLRDAAQPPSVPPQHADSAMEARIDAAARELLSLSQQGVSVDAKSIGDGRVFARFLALKFSAPGWSAPF